MFLLLLLWTTGGASATTLYVSLQSTNPVPPYSTWATAATNIQDAVDVAKAGDTVRVMDGVYAVGSRGIWWDASRVVVTNAVRLESVNGPSHTTIDGGHVGDWMNQNGVRCVYLGTNAVLSGFTLRNGYNGDVGGGAYGSTLHNCTLSGNSASSGGGAFGSTLYNCTLTGNSAISVYQYGSGGGASYCTLYNCTLSDNSASSGGGVSGSVLFNSVVYGNTNSNYSVDTVLNYCLTTPLPTNGIGNIAADPRFVNAAAGDFRLRPDSPCIDAGTNLLGLIVTDIDGEFRPWDGNRDGVAAFDIGAYEFRPSPVTLYVSLQSANPLPPYSTWATAATNIQDAVDVAKAGDTVRVMDGVYAVGSRDGNRVSVTNAIRLESVNGPLATTIDGGRNVRCVYLGTNAVLSGFTLTNGWAAYYGGGVYCEASGVVTIETRIIR